MNRGITIYLGSKCNLSCSYCHRVPDKEEPVISQKLLQWIKVQRPLRIHFMGGEPTLYMDQVKRVVNAAPKGSSFALTTNGILLDQYIDFFYRHQFLIVVSFDGSPMDLRGYDPFQKVIHYPNLSVSCTLYHGNTDFSKIIKAFAEKEKIIGRPLSFFPHIMHVTSEYNRKYSLTREDMQHIFQQYKECVSNLVENYERYGFINQRYMGIFMALYWRIQTTYLPGETYCVNQRLEKMDANGNRFDCLYVRDHSLPDETEAQREELKNFIKTKFPSCLSCHLYGMCGAACVKSVDHPLECYYYRRLYGWWKTFYYEHKEACDELGES